MMISGRTYSHREASSACLPLMLLALITAKRRFVFLSRYNCDEDCHLLLLTLVRQLDLAPPAVECGELNTCGWKAASSERTVSVSTG